MTRCEAHYCRNPAVIRDLGVWVCEEHHAARLALRFFEWALAHPENQIKAVLNLTAEDREILRARLEREAGIPPGKRTVKGAE
jgi:hypothetical protein